MFFKALFLFTLTITLLVNILFLFATKDKPPDGPTSTSWPGWPAGGPSSSPAAPPVGRSGEAAGQRRLFPRRSSENLSYFRDQERGELNYPAKSTSNSDTEQKPNLGRLQPAELANQTAGRWRWSSPSPSSNPTTSHHGGDGDVDSQPMRVASAWSLRQSSAPDKSQGQEKLRRLQRQRHRRRRPINVRVKSSRSHVFISIDNRVIYESKSSSSWTVTEAPETTTKMTPPTASEQTPPPPPPRLARESPWRRRLATPVSTDWQFHSQGEASRRSEPLAHNHYLYSVDDNGNSHGDGDKQHQGPSEGWPGELSSALTSTRGANEDGHGDEDGDEQEQQQSRGIHVVVLNQFDGSIMSKRVFDTYSPGQDDELAYHLHQLQPGRLLVLAVQDEASFKMPVQSAARRLLARLGSQSINRLQWRDMWAMVARSGRPLETSGGLGSAMGAASEAKSATGAGGHHSGGRLAESLSKSGHFSEWAAPVLLDVQVELEELDEELDEVATGDDRAPDCARQWARKVARWSSPRVDDLESKDKGKDKDDDDGGEDELQRRRRFCSRVEGYGQVCDCNYPAPISFETGTAEARAELPNWQLDSVPIVVIASNRPHYLYRMLVSLLRAVGVRRHLITVHIDGYYEEPLAICRLLNLRAVQQRPAYGQGGGGGPQASGHQRGHPRGGRISHHYKLSLSATFELHPEAQFAIIFEEDLDVAPDALLYFNQTLGVLRDDPSLYCVSAWNDQGYEHTVGDRRLIYRIETMPGLGWMLSRRLYKEELEPRWPAPELAHDWDMWIRTPAVRRGRECLIPDLSRTYHFGATGTNINSLFQWQYFQKHAFGRQLERGLLQFRGLRELTKRAYERHVERLIGEAQVIGRPAEGQLGHGTSENTTRANATDLEFLCSLATEAAGSEAELETEAAPSDLENNSTASGNRTTELAGSGQQAIVIFIEMIDQLDFRGWLQLARCWRIWDLDARGQHQSMWRLFLGGRPAFVVGAPASPYSRLKPSGLEPFRLV